MSELHPKLYFRAALFALLLPLASGEFSTIYNLLLKRSSLLAIKQLNKRNLCSDTSVIEGKPLTLNLTKQARLQNRIKGKFETSDISNL